jgi:very-short-patch-repair endonuclease
VNEWIAVPGEEIQCDFVWHRQRLIVETDGWATHRTPKALREDRRRDRLLRLAGWRVERFTYPDVFEDPEHVEHVVRTILERASAGMVHGDRRVAGAMDG